MNVFFSLYGILFRLSRSTALKHMIMSKHPTPICDWAHPWTEAGLILQGCAKHKDGTVGVKAVRICRDQRMIHAKHA